MRRVASANTRVLKGSLLSVSGLTSILPKMFSRVLMVAGHLSQWETVSSSVVLIRLINNKILILQS